MTPEPSRHISTDFDSTLEEMRRNVLMMGSLTVRNFENARKGLFDRDEDWCNTVIADDEETEFSVHRQVVPFEIGDTLLLCSDGVHQTLGQKVLEQLFDPRHSTQIQVDIFRTAVLKAGAPDNFSLILVKHTGDVPL